MPYEFSEQGLAVQGAVHQFMREYVYPNEPLYYRQLQDAGPQGSPPVLDKLKSLALQRNLWNLFLPDLRPDQPGTRLSNVDYAPVSEMLGAVSFAAEVLNCAAPDTGNMEILHRYGSETIKRRWLTPMLQGEVRSAFSMTEPDVASSDATNIGLTIDREGDCYVLRGRKWFSSGALSERCKVLLVMGRSDPSAPRHRQHSMIVVPKDATGVSLGVDPSIFGYDEPGGHPEVIYSDVRVPIDHLLGAEGDGFAIAQARLGPGRIHHCMRSIGVAERALELMVVRALERKTFGTSLAHKGMIHDWIAESRIGIDMARQYVLHTAHLVDSVGAKGAATEIAGIKVAIPKMALQVIDRAIQVHGAAGVTQLFPLAHMYASMRTLRIADGPDEVHKVTIARHEILGHHPGFRL